MVIDPRPDLRQDSTLWQAVLEAAQGTPEVQGLLHGLRCGGCRLKQRANGSLRLDYTPLLDVWDEDELRREWLEPNRRDIQDIFRRVRDFATSRDRRDSPE